MSQTESPDQLPPEAPSGPGPSTEDEGLQPDEIFHLLQTNRRRDAMRYLYGRDDPVRMRDLAEQVAAWENDTTVREITSAQRQRVYIPLYQTHLPKLDEAGVIEYDQSRGIVERTPLARELYPYIDGLDTDATDPGAGPGREGVRDDAPERSGDDRDWLGYYTGASGLGVGILAGSVLGVPLLSTMSGIIIGGIISVMFGLLTFARLVERRLDRPTG